MDTELLKKIYQTLNAIMILNAIAVGFLWRLAF